MLEKRRVNLTIQAEHREKLEALAIEHGLLYGGQPNISGALRLALTVFFQILEGQQTTEVTDEER